MSQLAKAILEVMNEVSFIQKSGKQPRQGYTYATEGDILTSVRDPMTKAGLVLVPSGISDPFHGSFKTSKGTHQNLYRATFHYKLIHKSGEEVELTAPGEGVDGGDKAAYQAATGALKYVLRQTFLLETGDDPDKTATVGDPQTETKKATKKAPASTKTNPEHLKKAQAYIVPDGSPFSGKTLGEAAKDPALGVTVVANLAGVDPDGAGKMFSPSNDDEKKLQAAAKYIFDHDPDFIKQYKEYKASVS